jgi:SAM-dependent methyltransferase
MDESVIQKLLNLNEQFYQTFAASFSKTRQRVQPGVLKIIEDFPREASVLDLGCGNGNLAKLLAQGGHMGLYLGLDSSQVLLDDAIEASDHPNSAFELAKLQGTAWRERLPGRFDYVFAFAVLHHIPGSELRSQLMRDARESLNPEGTFAFSVWNFMASPRLKARILPWEVLDLEDDQLDPGDYLLDWKRDGYGLRYVHSFEDAELDQLAIDANFEPFDAFISDGKGGKLGIYQLWKPRK